MIRMREQVELLAGDYVFEVNITAEVPQAPLVFLLTGSDDYFAEQLHRLKSILDQAGCETVLRTVREDIEETIAVLKSLVARGDGFRPLLVAFYGHGSPRGWEGTMDEPKFPYSNLAQILNPFSGPLFVMNDTCYGLEFLPYLWRMRQPANTGFVAPWNANGKCAGGPVEDAIEAWSQGKTSEEIHGEVRLFVTDVGDSQRSRQQRWGARFDQLFFCPIL